MYSLISNLRWLLQPAEADRQLASEAKTPFIVCIPALREQKIIESCVDYFSTLDYPKDKYRVYIVTTRKEAFEKRQGKAKLDQLAKDLVNGKSLDYIQSQYTKLFNMDLLKNIYEQTIGMDEQSIVAYLQKEYEQYPTTHQLAVKRADEINSTHGAELVQVIEYPHQKGVMGDQINYLVHQLADSGTSDFDLDSFFVVYNADSKPHPGTLTAVDQEIWNFARKNKQPANIIQQSSLFTANFRQLSAPLRAAAMLQTKWTLVHELSRLRSQSKSALIERTKYVSSLVFTRLGHCVGHGLFIRFSHILAHNLPTDTVNEDLPYGFYQTAMGEPIIPMKILENSDSPETFTSLINQKKVWYWPYVESLKCRRLALQNKQYRNKIELNVLTLKVIATGTAWLLQSLIFVLPLIIGLATQSLGLLVLTSIGWLVYWIIPVAIIMRSLPMLEHKAGTVSTHVSLRDVLSSFLHGYVAVATHSFGPALCVREFINVSRGTATISKDKTER